MLSDLDMLQNLQTLSTLQHNQKLCTACKVFTVQDNSGVLTGLLRSWYGEDRQANVARLQALFSLAMLRCENLILKGTDVSMRERIVHVVEEALPGLARLAQTYRGDVATVSSLAVLAEDVRAFLCRVHAVAFLDLKQETHD